MATIDLGKIKQVWRGTYNNGTAYTVDDLVAYTDSNITSTYICVANSTGNAPSSSGTAHASWNYVAKGVVDPIPSQSSSTNGKVLKSDGTNASWGTGGGLALIASGTGSSDVTFFNVDNCFSDTYKYYKLMYSWSANAWMKMRFLKQTDGTAQSSSSYYYAGSWFRRDAGGSHDVGQFGYFNQDHAILGYFDGQTHQPSFGEFNFHHPYASSFMTQYWGTCASKFGGGTGHTKNLDLTCSFHTTESHRGIQFLSSTGSHYLNSNFNYRIYGWN